MDIRQVQIISKREIDNGFEYYIRMPNRRMLVVLSERDFPVCAKVYVSCDYVFGNFCNIEFL